MMSRKLSATLRASETLAWLKAEPCPVTVFNAFLAAVRLPHNVPPLSHLFAASFSSFRFCATARHALAASMQSDMLASVLMAPAETCDRETTKPA